MAHGFGSEKLLRARLLRQQGRHEGAEAFLLEAISDSAEDADAFCELALCRLHLAGKEKSAIDPIDRALELEPTAYHFAVKALVLNALDKEQQAIKFADKAISLDPHEPFHFYVKAAALAGQSRWAASETECRQALALDPDDNLAKNLLAIVLRMQGKRWETEIAVGQLLEEDPEDAWAHANAGWAALTNSDHRKAEAHFRESLRLDPGDEHARSGLLESFKARSPLYRAYLKYIFWMARFEKGTRWAIIIGIYLFYTVGRVLLAAVHPVLAAVFVIVYLVFVFGGWLASGVGHLLVLADSSARYALNRREILDAIFVGGGFFGGFLLVIAGLSFGLLPLAFVGGALLVAAIPWALTFTNDSPSGRRLFGAIGCGVYLTGFWASIEVAMNGDISEKTGTLVTLALVAALLSTFLGNAQSLHK
jgi:Flp pilus assembly protein TadD